ncbi:TIR domain-containing protein [Paenibacillus mucilaginosus]|uniref:Nucleotide-binding protein-like protein containing TIR-like domain n=1 Tax=Paenibacillus mucilaginosus (strain KNP414) TaxID=1036673 RepID=F8FD13_PAEMK|nr:TIR domain-containing protein [Paenibacillus mucilaginosus]AEI41430.1 nucleotide-binding protein-like protein containing TIR-like domain [Paenibacillus mucilaginosus KNP414]MCG7217560.1 nucleotide-binding protein [Paenibacillus mucilaginosus]
MSTPMKTKPNTFIGSSREAMELASAMHAQLSYDTQVTPWYAGAFRGGEYTMEALERELNDNDFGVFVFAPDDVALHRSQYVFITRDNTLFEMGLFWGRLGRSRVYAVIPGEVRERDDLIQGGTVKQFHILSDLQGLTLLRYEIRTDDNFEAAVSVACREIIRNIRQQGAYQDPMELLLAKEAELLQKQSLLHFFWEYNRHVTAADAAEKYTALSEAVRKSILPPDGFRVTGAAFWQKQAGEGIGQVGGNVGKGRFFPFDANRQKSEGDQIIYVLDVFLSGKWTFFKRQELAQVYVLCYPLGTEHALSVHFAGRDELTDDRLTRTVTDNIDLLRTIDHLIGGDSV